MVCASAPAKLILAGEWSVLEPQGSALVLAVDERLRVAAAPDSQWRVSRTDRAPSGLRRDLEHCLSAVGAELAPPELRFLATVLERFREVYPERVASLASRPGGVTPGLGSSAAVVSAAVAALHAIDWGPDGARESHGAKGQRLLPPEVLFAEAFAAHHRAQRGKGSGCDVAAACFGGLVGYRRRGDALPSVELLDLGALPPLAAAHAGPKASTTQLIEAVERAGQQAPAALRDVRSALDGAAQRAIAAIRGREGVRAILAALADSSRALSELDRLADGRLEPAPVRELLRIARDEAAVAKISGAGGGDCVLAFAEHPDRITRVKALWARAGYRVLDLLPAMNGARLEDETIEKLPKAAT